MLPATYGVQKEVQLRHTVQRHEAGQWHLARIACGTHEPAVARLLGFATHASGAVLAGLERFRSRPAGSARPQEECC